MYYFNVVVVKGVESDVFYCMIIVVDMIEIVRFYSYNVVYSKDYVE